MVQNTSPMRQSVNILLMPLFILDSPFAKVKELLLTTQTPMLHHLCQGMTKSSLVGPTTTCGCARRYGDEQLSVPCDEAS